MRVLRQYDLADRALTSSSDLNSLLPMTDTTYDRRAFMAYFSSIGLGATLLPGVLWGQAQTQQGPEITKEMIASAEEISGLSFSDDERTAMLSGLRQMRSNIEQLHKEPLDQSVLPSIVFEVVPPGKAAREKDEGAHGAQQGAGHGAPRQPRGARLRAGDPALRARFARAR